MAECTRLDPFTISLPGAEYAVREGLARLILCLAPLRLGADEVSTVELVLAEALNNVIEHALAQSGACTTIEIMGSHSVKGLVLTIIDHGAPMPNLETPGARAPDVDVDIADLPEGGFGWFMIHTLAKDVHYARRERANHLSLRIAVGI